MNKQHNYNDYQSAWRNKDSELIRLEINQVKRWASTLDKYAQKESLKSGDKLDILNGILKERGE